MFSGSHTIRIYLSYYLRHPWLFGFSFLLGPANVLQYIVPPVFIAKALGTLAQTGQIAWGDIYTAAGSLLAGIGLWYVVDSRIATKLHTYVMIDLYNDCFRHILSQDHDFFANNFGGSLVTQANRFAKAYELLHTTFFLDLLGQLCSVLVAIVIIAHFSLPIGLGVALLWLVAVTLVIVLAIRRIPTRRAAVALESRQTGELADAVTNAITVKTFASEQFEAERYNRTNLSRADAYYKSWQLGMRNLGFISILGGTLQLSVVVSGFMAVRRGIISIATYLLFQVYVLRIIDSINRASLSVRFIEGALGDAHDMTELLARGSAVKDPAHPEPLRLQAGGIRFNAVKFAYQEQQGRDELFDNFNLHIQPGERVGLVGPSGGGKTTITKLLLRFMDVRNGGSITIDGQDIRTVTQADLHGAIGYVPQEPLLFHRSLAENISYGKPGAKKKEIIDAAKRAHAHEFISSLPKGYDTLVGERGIKLSGGQRQRIAIARAMLKNAPILILDEATSALDSESEKYIQGALWDLMQGKTTLVIAHRLSTIQHLDRIVVLDEGRITEQGTHKELLVKNGLYARLWKHQSGGFLED